MSHLCRLRNKSHGEDGQWAYEEITALRQRVAELEKERDKAAQYWQIAEGRCDALIKQRDDLVAALTYVIEDLELRASLKEDEDERGVVDIGDGAYNQAKEAIASVKEKA